MDFEKIKIENKELFDKYINYKQHGMSEFSFTNLFIWREALNIEFNMLDDLIVVSAVKHNGEPFYLMPLGEKSPKEVIEHLILNWTNPNLPIIRSLTKDMINEIEEVLPNTFTYTKETNSFEYIYLSEDLINLKGKKYNAKRNHINKFKKLYDYEYYDYNSSMKNQVNDFFENWYSNAGDLSNGLDDEKIVINRILNNFDKLDIKGGFIKVGEKIVACSFGDRLNDETFLIHIEKADIEYQGSYAIINQNFSEKNCKDFKYINREEDLGIEGLRKAKMSYYPTKFIDKFSACIK